MLNSKNSKKEKCQIITQLTTETDMNPNHRLQQREKRQTPGTIMQVLYSKNMIVQVSDFKKL